MKCVETREKGDKTYMVKHERSGLDSSQDLFPLEMMLAHHNKTQDHYCDGGKRFKGEHSPLIDKELGFPELNMQEVDHLEAEKKEANG